MGSEGGKGGVGSEGGKEGVGEVNKIRKADERRKRGKTVGEERRDE